MSERIIDERMIEELVSLAIRPHYNCEDDTFYGCPKSVDGCSDDNAGTECNCGADEHNARVLNLASLLRSDDIGVINSILKQMQNRIDKHGPKKDTDS